MLTNYDQIVASIIEMANVFQKQYGADAKQWPINEIQNNQKLKYLNRLLDIYWRYQARAERFGYVGVGCVTYAEYWLTRFQERTAHMVA